MWKIINRIKNLFKRKTKKTAPSFVEHYYTPEQCLFGSEEYPDILPRINSWGSFLRTRIC